MLRGHIRGHVRRSITHRRDTFTMEKPQRTARANFHPHYFTQDTPHVRIEDGYQRPYRPAGSWYEIDNQIGWAEHQLGSGGGLGSDRHTERLMDGIGWAGALAIVLVPGLIFPPLLLIGVPMLLLSVFVRVVDALAASEDRIRAQEAAEAAYMAQMPNAETNVGRAFGPMQAAPDVDAAYLSPTPWAQTEVGRKLRGGGGR